MEKKCADLIEQNNPNKKKDKWSKPTIKKQNLCNTKDSHDTGADGMDLS